MMTRHWRRFARPAPVAVTACYKTYYMGALQWEQVPYSFCGRAKPADYGYGPDAAG